MNNLNQCLQVRKFLHPLTLPVHAPMASTTLTTPSPISPYQHTPQPPTPELPSCMPMHPCPCATESHLHLPFAPPCNHLYSLSTIHTLCQSPACQCNHLCPPKTICTQLQSFTHFAIPPAHQHHHLCSPATICTHPQPFTHFACLLHPNIRKHAKIR